MTDHNGWEDIFRGVFEIEKALGKLDTTDCTESRSSCRAAELEKENESLYKLMDDLRDKLVKKDEKHNDEVKYWKKLADGFSNAGGELEVENTELKCTISETRADLEELKNDNRSLSVENGELKDQVNRLEDRIDVCAKARLNEELSGYAHKLVDAETEIDKLKDELKMAEDQRNDWINYGTRLEARNAELGTKIEHLQKELDEATNTNIELGKKVDDLQMKEQKLRGECYNLRSQVHIVVEENTKLQKALDRTQINDEAIIPMLYKLNKAFMYSLSNNADFGGWLQAYSHFSSLCDSFSEIYYIVDEKYPEEHIFELINESLLNIKDDFEKQIEVQKKLGNKENN